MAIIRKEKLPEYSELPPNKMVLNCCVPYPVQRHYETHCFMLATCVSVDCYKVN